MIETTIQATLRAALTGSPPPPVQLGVRLQPSDNRPAPLPVVIVQRIGSTWPSTFCGTADDLSLAQIQVDFYALQSDEALRHARECRAAFRNLPVRPTLQNEISLYDDASRSWRVVQTWTAPDDAPYL